jgi:hypothetical protein
MIRISERLLTAGIAIALFVSVAAAKETIVFVRHGEKPPHGLGQLDCRGLNRALALPALIQKSFGKPDAIFAPNPSDQKMDAGEHYDYVRPLITIEPTAIAFGMPVNAQIGYDDTERLRKALENPAYRDALVLVGWEHRIIAPVARELLSAHGGNPTVVPDWNSDDFDSVYVVTIDASRPKPNATFAQTSEGLNGLPETCPK